MVKKKCLMIGAGGFAWSRWIQHLLPSFCDRVEPVGLVDIDRQALTRSAEFLKLPSDRCFENMQEAFERVEADFCCVVVPPAAHAEAVVAAAGHGLAILSEKPIADTPEAVGQIYGAVKQAGVKMAVIQNYRYTERMWTMRQVLGSGRLGRLNYLVARFAADYRQRGAWGTFRHEIPDALVIEGAVHHFDMIRNLCGANCRRLGGFGWNPAWSSFEGDCVGLYVCQMENETHAIYEGNCCEAGKENSWHGEYYRAECQDGAVEIDADQQVRIIRVGQPPEPVPMVAPEPTGHAYIFKGFLDWLDGGPAPETRLDDNIHSAAMMFAAIQAGKTGQSVRVADFLPDHQESR